MLNHIIWDWNGTLLDDAPYSLALTNRILADYGLPQMDGLDVYRSIFTFPVVDYYTRLGLGGERFDEAAHRWMDAYMANETVCPLQPGAAETAVRFRDAGLRQVIISASKLENLHRQLSSRPAFAFFDPPRGLGDIYAGSKVDIARQWMADTGADGQRTLVIGDTLHDREVARALNCRCILVEGGHQSRETLLTAGVPVVASLQEAAVLALGGA